MPNDAKLNTVREHASALECDLGRPLAQSTSHVQNPLQLVDNTPQLHDASGTITTMRAWNPKGAGNGIQYQDTRYLYESPFDGSFATSTIYRDSSDTTSSSNLIANPTKLTDWTLDSQGNWVDSLSVNSPTGGDATTDGNVNFFDLTTLAASYGSSDNVRWRNGDFDGDGSVNFYDQTTLSANYGASGGNVGTLQTRSTNAANEITSVSGSWVTPTYDAAGNMVSAPKAGAETTRLWYVYDAWNRQVIVKNDSSGSPGSTLATYSYDGLNRRVTKVTTGEDGATFDDYFNESWQRLESRKNGDTDPLDQFLWDLTYIDTPVLRWHDANTDGDLADVSPDAPGPTYDNTLYYTTDANNNITALYDADQERVIERYVYDPYGKTFLYDRTWGAISSSAVDNNVQWGGYVSDKETGNKLARWRPYNVPLGTWYARDFAGHVDGMNLYQYVESNPAGGIDPTGLWQIKRNRRESKARATPDAGDTISSLADKIMLNSHDWRAWLTVTSGGQEISTDGLELPPQDPVAGYQYCFDVPNTFIGDFGDSVNWAADVRSPHLKVNVFDDFDKWLRQQANDANAMGMKVEINGDAGSPPVTNTQIVDHLRGRTQTKDLYWYVFAGHGSSGIINTQQANGGSGVPAAKYTAYGVNQMVLYACESVAPQALGMQVHVGGHPIRLRGGQPRTTPWRLNVSESGRLSGYEESVSWYTDGRKVSMYGVSE